MEKVTRKYKVVVKYMDSDEGSIQTWEGEADKTEFSHHSSTFVAFIDGGGFCAFSGVVSVEVVKNDAWIKENPELHKKDLKEDEKVYKEDKKQEVY